MLWLLHPRVSDISGRIFGRVTVIAFAKLEKGHAYWQCRCSCGNIFETKATHLKSGNTLSCGCLKRELATKQSTTHGQYGTPAYISWQRMMARCYNPNSTKFENWGGRGIKVCERWHVFENFFEDMGERDLDLSLERRDNDGNYCPENCYWATDTQQANNRRAR